MDGHGIKNGMLNSRWFQSLPNVDDEDSEDDPIDDCEEEHMDVDKIYWNSEKKLYAHVSDMRYDTQSKNFIIWVTDNLENNMCLYYFHFQGVLKRVRTGKRGQVNSVVLRDKDWDISRISKEKSHG